MQADPATKPTARIDRVEYVMAVIVAALLLGSFLVFFWK
jgi:hypothetical protein